MKGDRITQLLYARLTAELNGKYKTSIVSAFAGRARPNGPERDLATFRRAVASLKPLFFPQRAMMLNVARATLFVCGLVFLVFILFIQSVSDVSTIFILQEI